MHIRNYAGAKASRADVPPRRDIQWILQLCKAGLGAIVLLLFAAAGEASAGSANVSLSSSPNPSSAGQTVTLTATVASTGGSFDDSSAPGKIASGYNFSCAIQLNRTVKCWGINDSGQLGDGTTTSSATPVKVTAIANAVAVTAGFRHSCAVLEDGTVWCWGGGSYGVLGNGTSVSSPTPVQVSGVTTAVAITSGQFHSCALLQGGTVACWGNNYDGELGSGTNSPSAVPVQVSGITSAAAIAAGNSHSCALVLGGTVRCWGAGYSGQLGDGSGNNSPLPVTVSGLYDATALAAGGSQSCALRSGGGISCWGANNVGQLGNGSRSASYTPTAVANISDAIGIAAGSVNGCAILADRTLRCWGSNFFGELGNGAYVDSALPVQVNGVAGAVAVAPALYHVCAIQAGGTIQCWGDNRDGELGNGTTANTLLPTPVSGFTGGQRIAAYNHHTCAVHVDGHVSCWGDNSSGQLGDGSTASSPVPVNANGISGAIAVATGYSHSCAVASNGTVWCWGSNDYGQLGNGQYAGSTVPSQVVGITNAVAVSAGYAHSCALLNDGSISCWGYGGVGQLGNNAAINSPVPVAVIGISTAQSLASGGYHNCAVLTDGSAWCWGYNYYGQLGDGTTAASALPKQVSGLANVVRIAASGSNSCALLQDGTLRCWGPGGGGNLGSGTSQDSLVPVQVSGITSAVDIAVGSQTCAALANGTVQCWGYGYGRGSFVPVEITGINGAVAVAAGASNSCAVLADGSAACWGNNDYGQLGVGYSPNPAAIADPLTGIVSFMDGGNTIGSASVLNGLASTSTAGLLPGSHVLKASYSGSFPPVTSADVTQDVTGLPQAISWTQTLSGAAGGSIVLTATAGASGNPVTYSGTPGICTVSGSSLDLVAPGNCTVTASQAGNATYQPAADVSLSFTVAIGDSEPPKLTMPSDVTVSTDPGSATAIVNYTVTANDNVDGAVTPVLTAGLASGSAFPVGVTTVRYTATDAAGNNATASFTVTVRDTEPPVLTVPSDITAYTAPGAATAVVNYVVTATDNVDGAIAPALTAGLSSGQAFPTGATTVRYKATDAAGSSVTGTFTVTVLATPPRTTITSVSSSLNPSTPGTPVTFTAAVNWPGGTFDGSAQGKLGVGYGHSCAVMADKTVSCWGWNDFGQLGDGTATSRKTPFTVPGLTGVVQASAGDAHSCALLDDGTVKCWGGNWVSMVGDGTTTNRLLPTTVSGVAGAVALAVKGASNCALINDGTVKCWGWNAYGQLGDGTTVTQPAAVPVAGLGNVASLSLGGYYHMCALINDGSVKCWGLNDHGQLGDGSTNQQLTPVTIPALQGAKSIALGLFHSCAVMGDDTVTCWGQNDFGQVGDGTNLTRTLPTAVPGLTHVKAVSLGLFHSCALLADGTEQCWGRNDDGRLGDGTTTQRASPVPVTGLAGAVATSLGFRHSCAVLDDGSATCWGWNGFGQLGTGDADDRYVPAAAAVEPVPGNVAIYDGADSMGSGVLSGGKVSITTSQLGAGAHQVTARYLGTASFEASSSTPLTQAVNDTVPPALTVPADITVATDPGSATAVVNYAVSATDDVDGTITPVLTAGLAPGSAFPAGVTTVTYAATDVAGNSTTASFTVTVQDREPPGLTVPSDITVSTDPGSASAVVHYTVAAADNVSGTIVPALTAGLGSGSAFPVGVTTVTYGASDAAGNSATASFKVTVRDTEAPVLAVPADITVRTEPGVALAVVSYSVSASDNLGGAITPVLVAGPVSGQSFGIGVTTVSYRATDAAGNSATANFNVTVIGTPQRTTVTTVSSSPNPSALGAPVTFSIAVKWLGGSFDGSAQGKLGLGYAHSCAVMADKTVTCWGKNEHGQIGDGTLIQRASPTTVPGLAGVVQASAGDEHSCALLEDGTVKCWGGNWVAMLGDGTYTNRPSPVPVSGVAGAVALAVKGASNCALINDGTVKCWGWNAFGQLGDGTTSTQPSAVTVAGLNNVASLSLGGYYHMCALIDDGSVKCWGRNDYGQLGNGSTSGELTPVTIPALQGAKSIALGLFHSCAVMGDATVKCWGLNDNGQLGDGTTISRTVPTTVPGLANVKAVSLGLFHSCALLADGTEECWGLNDNGRLGDGSTAQRSSPVAVTGLSGAVATSLGFDHSCAVLADGSATCWGWNGYGQLGTDDGIDHSTPAVTDIQPVPGDVTLLDGATLTGSSSLAGGKAVITAPPQPGSGWHSIVASYQGTVGYAPSSSDLLAQRVNRAPQAISWTQTLSGMVGGTLSLTATGGASGNPVTFSGTPGICTVVGSTLSLNAAGTCFVTASQAESTDYDAAPNVQRSFVIDKGQGTVSWTQTLSGSVGDSIALTANSTPPSLLISYSSSTTGVCTVNGSTVTLIAVGTCTVWASQASTSDYGPAPPVFKSFTVAPGAQSISWTQTLSGAVGTTVGLTATASSGLAVSYSSGTTGTCTVSGSTLTLLAVGNCTVTATQPGNANYAAAAPASRSFTVTIGSQTISWTQTLSGLPGGTLTLTATASSGLAVSYASSTVAVCTVSGTTLTFLTPGTCSVTASQPGNANYLAATPVQRSLVLPPPVISVYAGSPDGQGYAAGLGTSARYNAPSGIVADSSGNFYVADSANNVIRVISPTGSVSTLAGQVLVSGAANGTGASAQFNNPSGIAIFGSTIYVADTGNHLIRKLTTAGVATTLAGSAGKPGSADGTGTAASFNNPTGIVTDSAGNIFVSDSGNSTIRKITPAGAVTTFAGKAGNSGNKDATGTTARFSSPSGIARDASNNLYVADPVAQTVRKITSAGVVKTLAGTYGTPGSIDGTGLAAQFSAPMGVVTDTSGNVFVSEAGNANSIRKISPSGVVTTPCCLFANPIIYLSQPKGLTRDANNGLYAADARTHAILGITISANGASVGVISGALAQFGSTDGNLYAQPVPTFSNPGGVVMDSGGNLFIADTDNSTIRKVTPAGVVSTFAGTALKTGAADGTGTAASFNRPTGLAIDSANTLYVADTGNHTIRKITSSGVVSTIAGSASTPGLKNGTGTGTSFRSPAALAVTTGGTLYVADTGNYVIRKIVLSSLQVSTLAGTAGVSGTVDTPTAQFGLIYGLGVDSAGNLFAADYSGSTIRKITAAGAVSTFAGTASSRGTTDATGSAARFSSPFGIAVDSANTIYVTDYANCLLRRISPTAVVTSLVGTPGTCKFVPGSAPSTLNAPRGLTKAGSTVYFTAGNGVARVVNVP